MYDSEYHKISQIKNIRYSLKEESFKNVSPQKQKENITQVRKVFRENRNNLLSKISLKEGYQPNIVHYLKHNQDIFKRSLSKNQQIYCSKINQHMMTSSNTFQFARQIQIKNRKTHQEGARDSISKQSIFHGDAFPKINKSQKFFTNYIKKDQYKIEMLRNVCFDNIFIKNRCGSVITSTDKSLYLIGGYHLGQTNTIYQYDFENQKWLTLKTKGENPFITPCYHTVEIYKNYLVIIGGISIDGQLKKTHFNQQIYTLDLINLTWYRIQGLISLKNHASTIFGGTIMVHGGQTQKFTNSNQIYFINLTNTVNNNLQLPYIVQIQDKDANFNLSHHKLINTSEIDLNIKMKLKVDGVICFGGVTSDCKMNNQLSLYSCFNKNGQYFEEKNRKWEIIDAQGQKPCPRKSHSFTLISKRATAVLIGGLDEKLNQLADIWALDLFKLIWYKVTTSPSISILSDSIYQHGCCMVETKLIVYNNNTLLNINSKALWYIQTESKLKTKNSKLSRQSTRRNSKNYNSSMWNLSFQ